MLQGQQGYPALSNSLTQSSQAASSWSQARLSLQQQQQQNPMLNSQLTVSKIKIPLLLAFSVPFSPDITEPF
jgi:hypothetical protein